MFNRSNKAEQPRLSEFAINALNVGLAPPQTGPLIMCDVGSDTQRGGGRERHACIPDKRNNELPNSNSGGIPVTASLGHSYPASAIDLRASGQLVMWRENQGGTA